ncbi:hypothetical protein [Paludisphaera borealis]|uniref:Uncharacterized protein n=1 Tax=Paludisphaera borealis TaxID=1387353 RepID=A0A1U7CXV9_9BACT|nr:hypothetical protein [Paludisphaera borealis]APW63790.1 hypothetical protein BSF38_05367 [Paludisphaera borealis]
MRSRLAVVLALASMIALGFYRERAFRAAEAQTGAPAVEGRYDPVNPSRWFRGALAWNASPVDLRFLNKDDRPAGRRGFVKAVGDQMVFEDGTPARFWGGNLAAYALFTTPRQTIAAQARRMAQLGYNLMRIHHHDSSWVHPNVFDAKSKNARRLDVDAFDSLDWWIKCLKDEGIYVWLDMQVGRQIEARDHLEFGAAELLKTQSNLAGFCYYNPDVQRLMKEFQNQYLSHVNPYTKMAYKDDPAVIGVLLTNENDLAHHFGNRMLPDKGNPFHTALFTKDYKAFAKEHGLPESKVFQTWMAGPSKIYLGEIEHRFNKALVGDLRAIGVRAPIATTNYWGASPLFVLPSLTDGDVIDVHSYGKAEELSLDPRREPGFVHWIGAAQVSGKPLTITEWNVPYPTVDRFTSPLYVASLAALQGWDAPMIYNYSQDKLQQPGGPSEWSSFFDPALTGVMPAAALLYRRGHVSPAKKTFHLALTPAQLFDRDLSPKTSATIRTLVEQSRLTIGLPAVKELPWLAPSKPPEGAVVIDDPDRDMLPQGASEVRSDTGELTRDWNQGIQFIDTARTQSVSGWIGGKELKTADARFQFRTKKAVVALTSIDDQPLDKSRFILVTAVARAVPSDKNHTPLLSEPVVGTVDLKTEVDDLELLALAADGKVVSRLATNRIQGVVSFTLPAGRGTHWFVLKSRPSEAKPTPDQSPQPASAPL